MFYLSESITIKLCGWLQINMESKRRAVVPELSLNDVRPPDIMFAIATDWLRMKSPTVKTHESPPAIHPMLQLKNPASVMTLGCLCDGLRRQWRLRDVTSTSSRPKYQHSWGFDDKKKVVMPWLPSNYEANHMMFIQVVAGSKQCKISCLVPEKMPMFVLKDSWPLADPAAGFRGGGGNLARGPNLGYPKNWKHHGFNALFFGWTQIHFRKVFWELFFLGGGGGKSHDGHPSWALEGMAGLPPGSASAADPPALRTCIPVTFDCGASSGRRPTLPPTESLSLSRRALWSYWSRTCRTRPGWHVQRSAANSTE